MKGSAESLGVDVGLCHDIRTHLNILLGAASVMGTGRMAREQVIDYAAVIRHNALAMLRMVNHLLAEDESSTVLSANAQIDGLLCEIAQGVAPYAAEKQIELLHDIQTPLYALCDPEMLERVLYNLLSNGIQSTGPQGIVHLSAQEREGCVEILVSDTGSGFTREQLEQLCSPHTGVGNGRGLRLVKKLVAAMNARFECSSEEGVGTTFYLYLQTADETGAYAQGNKQIASEEMTCLAAHA